MALLSHSLGLSLLSALVAWSGLAGALTCWTVWAPVLAWGRASGQAATRAGRFVLNEVVLRLSRSFERRDDRR